MDKLCKECARTGVNVFARGWCQTCYTRWRRTGDPTHIKPGRTFVTLVQTETHRVCLDCKYLLPLDQFHKVPTNTTNLGLCRHCKACAKIRTTASRYGLTKQRMRAIFEACGYACELCGDTDRLLVVDHDHSCCPTLPACGKCVRGVLCNRCNTMLGQAGDNAELLRKGAEYLERTSVTPSQT